MKFEMTAKSIRHKKGAGLHYGQDKSGGETVYVPGVEKGELDIFVTIKKDGVEIFNHHFDCGLPNGGLYKLMMEYAPEVCYEFLGVRFSFKHWNGKYDDEYLQGLSYQLICEKMSWASYSKARRENEVVSGNTTTFSWVYDTEEIMYELPKIGFYGSGKNWRAVFPGGTTLDDVRATAEYQKALQELKQMGY